MATTNLFEPNRAWRVGGRVLDPTFASPTASAPVGIAALALAAVASGAVAIGALAIGRLVIRKAVIRELEAERVHIGVLTVDEVQIAGRRSPDAPDADAASTL